MKRLTYILLIVFLVITSCTELDLNPLSEASNETWYSDGTEIEMVINSLYDQSYWLFGNNLTIRRWNDDWMYRLETNLVTGGTINGESSEVKELWSDCYTLISRANNLLTNLTQVEDDLPEDILIKYAAQSRFVRACMYSRLIFYFGDVVYYTETIDLDDAFTIGRTAKNTVLQAIYDDFDFAALNLPESYGANEVKWATKGTALAMKARTALYQEDWSIARQAASACMNLDIYELYPDFRDLFLSKTKNPNEVLFSMPRSLAFGNDIADYPCRQYVTRLAGGYGHNAPTYYLFASFLCTDGLPIDESPLFNPQDPFKNRDPRCAETAVEFQTEHLGYMYQPHIDSLTVLNFNTGAYVTNDDCHGVKIKSSFNGMMFRKSIDEDWIDRHAEVDEFIIRYADVLLIYAESSIESGQIDQSVLDAMNSVRARAYGVSKDEVTEYPQITVTDQVELRKILRVERRMEFALEGRRYYDLIRWRLAEKVLNQPNYGLLDNDLLHDRIINPGLWFWPETPSIDEDGVIDFSAMYNNGYLKFLNNRTFDASKQYLWPIPSKEILINDALTQNPGY